MLLKKRLSFFVAYISILLMLSHLLYWRQYSFKVLFLESSFVLTQKKQNVYALIGICNKLEYFSCSTFLLNYLLHQYPGDSLALFNLAYIEYKKNNWKLSEAYLQNYLSLKENNIKAYLLYSKILQKLNKKQASLDILYWAFSKKRDPRLVQALVVLLNLSNNSTEALSLLLSISNSPLKATINFNGQNYNFLKKKYKKFDSSSYDSFSKLLVFSKKSFSKNLFKYTTQPSSVRLFSVRGGDFFIPMRLKKKTAKPQALQLVIGKKNFKQKEMVNKISLSVLEENYFFLDEELKVGNEITVPNIFIGPWGMRDIKFKICQNCQSQLYIQNLSSVSYKLTKKYIFYFLNIFI